MKPIYYVIIAIVAIIMIGLSVLIVILNKKKKPHIKVDFEYINRFVTILGGKDNINSVSTTNGRLKVTVLKLEDVMINDLSSLEAKGVMISGNNIKALFKYDSEIISKEINKIIK